MDGRETLPDYRVQSAVLIDETGRPTGAAFRRVQEGLMGEEPPVGLRLTMRDGAEYNLWLEVAR